MPEGQTTRLRLNGAANSAANSAANGTISMRCPKCGGPHPLIDCPHLKSLPGAESPRSEALPERSSRPQESPEDQRRKAQSKRRNGDERSPEPKKEPKKKPSSNYKAVKAWRMRNKAKYNAYQREYMRKRREEAGPKNPKGQSPDNSEESE